MDGETLIKLCKLLCERRLSPSHLIILQMCKAEEGSMKDFSQKAAFSTANATGVVDTLVKKGLVERVYGTGDRRKVLVRITSAGAVELQEILSQIRSLKP